MKDRVYKLGNVKCLQYNFKCTLNRCDRVLKIVRVLISFLFWHIADLDMDHCKYKMHANRRRSTASIPTIAHLLDRSIINLELIVLRNR